MLAPPDDDDEEPCDLCPPLAPPRFLTPPPPTPSTLAPHCPALHFCQIEPVGAEFTQSAFPPLPVVAVCSSVVIVTIMVASFLLWKHKKKVQNLLPCKQSGAPDAAITYDDVLINHHPTRLPNTLTPIELLDVKYSSYVQSQTMDFSLSAKLSKHKEPQQTQRLQENSKSTPSNHRDRQQQCKRLFRPIYEEVASSSPSRQLDSDTESDSEDPEAASDDDFAEDELSLAGRASSGDERASQKLGERPAHPSSLERNKDGHPSFQAKQNYYLNKSMLGPDFTYPEDCISPSSGEMDQGQYQRTVGSSLNYIPALLQQQRAATLNSKNTDSSSPPGMSETRQGMVSALYNPHHIPDALLREMTYKAVPMSSRSLPVPPSCRTVSKAPLAHFPSISRTRSGSTSEFSRPPTPPALENIYASIDDVGPFTIGGGGRRQARRGSEPPRSTVGRRPHKLSDRFKSASSTTGDDHEGSDMRIIYDSRTACT